VTSNAGKLSHESAGVAHNIRVLTHLSHNGINYDPDQPQTTNEAALSTAVVNAYDAACMSQTEAQNLARDNAADVKDIVKTAIAEAYAHAHTLKQNA
jgi:uncharacterized protein YggE